MTDARSDTSHFSICFILSLLFYWSTDTGSGEADVTAGDAGSGGGDFLKKWCSESDLSLNLTQGGAAELGLEGTNELRRERLVFTCL